MSLGRRTTVVIVPTIVMVVCRIFFREKGKKKSIENSREKKELYLRLGLFLKNHLGVVCILDE